MSNGRKMVNSEFFQRPTLIQKDLVLQEQKIRGSDLSGNLFVHRLIDTVHVEF